MEEEMILVPLRDAQQRFRDDLQQLLDDPSCLVDPYRDCEPAEAIQKYRELAFSYKLDFNLLLVQLGTVFEVERLLDIESGRLKPVSRKLA